MYFHNSKTDLLSDYRIIVYKPSYKEEWDGFVAEAKNPSLLFYRDFMGYHKERFEDYSLMVYNGEKLAALFPANKKGEIIYSHQGLTFGGLILSQDLGFKKTKSIFETVLAFLEAESFNELVIKCLPVFYHHQPSNEMEHLLLAKGAEIINSDLNFGIDYSQPILFHKTKRKHFKKGKDQGLTIEEGALDDFWNKALKPKLEDKFDAEPVHTLPEIKNLQNKFPQFIKQFNIYENSHLLAGLTLFISDKVVKSQYSATTQLGEKLRALDVLFITLIEKYKAAGFRYFDMGTVQGGFDDHYNFGLVKQKEELGARAYLQHTLKLRF